MGLASAIKHSASIESKKEKFIRIPQAYQPNSSSCGVAVAQSILAYYGKPVPYGEDFEKELQVDMKNGVRTKEIVKAMTSRGLKAELKTAMLWSDLTSLLDEEVPVILLIQAWPDKGRNVFDSWEDGHYVVAVGYDKKNVYFMDPSTLGHYTSIPVNDFLKRWHDTDGQKRLINSGIIVRGEIKYDPDEVTKLG